MASARSHIGLAERCVTIAISEAAKTEAVKKGAGITSMQAEHEGRLVERRVTGRSQVRAWKVLRMEKG